MILKRPILTEKTYKLAQNKNQYTFEVNGDASKNQIAKAIEGKFDVDVLKVRIVNQLGKIKRFGATRKPGRRSSYKKAIVTLKEKQSIDLFEIK